MMVCVHCTRKPFVAERFGGAGVARVADQDVEKVFVGLGDAGDRTRESLRCHQNSRRAGDRSVADDRADGGNFSAGAQQASRMPGTARIGPMLVMGLLGAIENRVGGE